jgi:hypothetical protein
MKVLLDIKESKALFFMELLNNFSFVKVQPVSERKTFLLQDTEKIDVVAKRKTFMRRKNTEKDIFAEVWGIWADRDIDGTTLRNQAWGIEN